MNLKLELTLKESLNIIADKITDIDIDVNDIIQTKAISALEEIQQCLKNDELSDFEIIEEIVLIFEKYNIDCSPRHDF